MDVKQYFFIYTLLADQCYYYHFRIYEHTLLKSQLYVIFYTVIVIVKLYKLWFLYQHRLLLDNCIIDKCYLYYYFLFSMFIVLTLAMCVPVYWQIKWFLLVKDLLFNFMSYLHVGDKLYFDKEVARLMIIISFIITYFMFGKKNSSF